MKIIAEFDSPDARKSAYAFSAILAADKGVGSTIEQEGTAYLVVADDGKAVKINQAGKRTQ